ncbi:hypothetical protein DS66_04785, partial [Mesotoga sp. SC_3PWM13N19]
MDQKPKIGMILFYVVLGIFLLIALRGLYPTETSVVVPYSKFLDDFNNIIDIVVYDNGKVVYITGDNLRRSLETYVPSQTLMTQSFQNHIDRLA